MNSWKGITYIQPGDPEAWIDWKQPRAMAPAFMGDDAIKCPACRGYGGWNLLLGEYLSASTNTSENRHLFSHMKATCHGCAGHGWVRPTMECLHEFRITDTHGGVTHLVCVSCKKAINWDTRRQQ